MELISARPRCNGNVGSRVSAFFWSRVGSSYLEFLHIVGIQPENVVRRIRVGGFIGLNAVYGNVYGGGTGTIDVHRIA